MRGKLAVWIAAPVLVVLLGLIAVLATSDDDPAASPLLGRQAPSIESVTIDGEAFDLDEYRGRFVVVNFFAPWCVPCVQEHPELVNFERRQGGDGGDVAVVSVIFDAEVDAVRSFFEREGGDWPVVTDPDDLIQLDYGVTGLPESYLVAPDGIVLTKINGQITAAELDLLLAEARGA